MTEETEPNGPRMRNGVLSGPATSQIGIRKQELRQTITSLRRKQSDKEGLSARIVARLAALPAFQTAARLCIYVDVRDEVRTRAAIADLLRRGREVCVPFCDGPRLRLIMLRDLSELNAGRYGILEPAEGLQHDPTRQTPADQVSLFIVPGVAFDEYRNRLGHGHGFYDRLLGEAPNSFKVGLAFECQVVANLPVEQHDVPLDVVVTPERTIPLP